MAAHGSMSTLPLHGCAGLPSACMTSGNSASSSTGSHILRDTISLELAELDEKEEAIMEPICRRRLELRRLWNCSLPIHKIPHELLVQIFEKLPHAPWRRRDQYTSARHPWLDVGWPGLMLVCWHWRHVLISTPTFWREIHSGRKPSWTSLCISRSATISIDVHVESHCSLNHLLDNLRPHVYRFRKFHFSTEAPDTSLLPAITPFFNDPMRLLEKLHITVKAGRETEAPSRIDAQITSERFPSLKVLVLRSPMVAPQDISLYAQLRMLELDGCSLPLSLDGFLDALVASERLEELHLSRGVLHHLSGEWPHGGTRPIPFRAYASLPRLRHFELTDCRMDRTSCFLAHVRLQPFTDIYIAASVSEETTNTIDAMLPPNRNTTIPALGLATKAWLAVYSDEYSISSSHGRPHAHGHLTKDSSHVVLKLDSGNHAVRDRAMTQGLEDLVQAFGMSPLTCLYVSGNQGQGTMAAWERFFRTFPLLEELSISGDCDDTCDVIDVFRGLPAASACSTHASSVVACPNLRDVCVGGASTSGATYKAIRDCFRYRGDKGFVLELLDMQFSADWRDVPSPLRHEIVRDISGAVKVIRTPTAHNVSQWGREHQENNDSDDEIALVM